jgi:Zinc finger, C3HC4 type (RING finger)
MPSQVSAEAAAVATLHCVICFDEFNLNDQPPVVLPCGHTYVCASCSKRLKVCMECREPLFWIPPRAPLPPPLQQQRFAHRGYNGTRYNSLAPALQNKSPIRESVEPIPLPLPRNLVLLAIMEAAQRAKMLQGEINEGDQEDGELSRIMLSLEKMNGTCGTYAVKDMEGLAVLPLDPRKRHPRRPNSYLDTTMNNSNSNSNEPYTIQWGQTLQIVDVQDGVYRLARECGYVVASATQLVKST